MNVIHLHPWHLARIDRELSEIERTRSLCFGRLVSPTTTDKGHWLRLVEEADSAWSGLMRRRLRMMGELVAGEARRERVVARG